MFELVRDKESFIQNLMVSLNAMKEYVTILEQTAKFMGPVPAHLSLQIEQGWEHYADLKALQANQSRASPSSPGNVIQIAVHTFTGWFRVAAAREGLVCNLVDSPAELGRTVSESVAEHDKLEKCETMLRFRGGLHCRKIEGVRYQRPLHVHT